MSDAREMEIKRLEHLRGFIKAHPCKETIYDDEYIRANDVIEMINASISAVREEQVHRKKN